MYLQSTSLSRRAVRNAHCFVPAQQSIVLISRTGQDKMRQPWILVLWSRMQCWDWRFPKLPPRPQTTKKASYERLTTTPCAGWGKYCGCGVYGSEQSKPMSPTRSGQGAGNHWTPVSIESFAMRWAGSCHERILLPQCFAPPFLSWLLRPTHHSTHHAWKCQAHVGCKPRAKVRQSRHVSPPERRSANSFPACKSSTGNVLLRCVFHPGSSRTRPYSYHVSYLQLYLQWLAQRKWNWDESICQRPSPSSPRGALSVVGS